MKLRVYVDGQEGTTGLRIHELLALRADVEVLKIEAEKRKDAAERKKLLNAADIVFLCLPESAAREAAGLVENPRTKVIDASTAHRVNPEWVYGLPELGGGQRERIREATRVAVPGCHASAFVLGLWPLVKAGVVKRDAAIATFSITGYSGGGRKMIGTYEAGGPPEKFKAPRPYALGLMHKHLPEMQKFAGLARAPLFTPVVCNVHSGLAVEIFLPAGALARKVTPAEVHGVLARHYAGEKFVRMLPVDQSVATDDGFFDITTCNGTNRAEIGVFGHDEPEGQVAVIARMDNLGKGASGAAIQCMNLMMGVDEGAGLVA